MAMQVASLFASIGAETKGLEKGLSDAESKIKKTSNDITKIGEKTDTGFGDKWKSIVGTITSTAVPLAAALGVAKKALDFSYEGAQLQRLEDTSYSLARSMGMDMGNIVSSVRSASLGMVSDSDIMQASSRAMMLGVGNSAEQLAQLMEVAAMRGRAMGISTTQAFNDIVTGIGRMSPMILDNLGIITGGQKTFDEYAASIGKVSEALTDAEKKQALINKAIEETEPLLQQEGGLARDVAGNWEYATAQIKTYIDTLKKAMALERGGEGGFDYANGMPVGKTGGMGYIESIGLAFERANIDSHNKDLIKLAANIGLITQAEARWANMPVIGTIEARAALVTGLNPALQEYNRLVNETGMTSKIAAEQVTYLYDTYGNSAFIDKTDEWAAANDRVWTSLENITTAAENVGTGIPKSMQLAGDAIADLQGRLAESQFTLSVAIQTFYESVGESVYQGLKDAGLEGEELEKRLKFFDDLAGTDLTLRYKLEVETDQLIEDLLDPNFEANFSGKFAAFDDLFQPLIAEIATAKAEVDTLQSQIDALEGVYEIQFLISTSGTLPDLGGDWGGGGWGGGGYSVTAGLKAMGGYGLSGQPYIVGEAGPELFIPDVNGRVYSNSSSSAMMGGDNGDLLAALGKLPSASDIAMAVRDALLMAGA